MKYFESLTERSRVKISNYHSDKGRYTDDSFKNYSKLMGKGHTDCGVDAHFQKGIAEVRDLQDRASAMIIHAKIM
jgi:hypothetical protein